MLLLPTALPLLALPAVAARLIVHHPRADDTFNPAIAASQAAANATVQANLAAKPAPTLSSNIPPYHNALASYSSETLPAVPIIAPPSFLWGCATSAYQIEGSTNAGGRGESNWDAYVHNRTAISNSQPPGTGNNSMRILNNQDADVAVDFYNSYPTDIPLFKRALGIDTFSFSIAWTRILPLGNETEANQAGVNFYKDVIKVAKDQNMLTSCTLFHWDFPQQLQTAYGGWLDDQIIEDYAHYVEITMRALGHGCDIWIGVNEPRTFCTTSYVPTPNLGAPGFPTTRLQTFECVHRVLLAHSRGYEIFERLKGGGKVHGRWAIKVDGAPLIPWDLNNGTNTAMTQPAMDMGQIGWVVAPLTTGNYPWVMRKRMGVKLPAFTREERKKLKDSYDIIFWDSYATLYAKPVDGPCLDETNAFWPSCVELTSVNRGGQSIGEATGSFWNFQANDTIIRGLSYMHNRWAPKALAIGENGLSLPGAANLSLNDTIHDEQRVRWYRTALTQINSVLAEGKIPFVGYFAWSCISNFEWTQGYNEDFGLIYSQPGPNQTRYVKDSAAFLQASFANKAAAVKSASAPKVQVHSGWTIALAGVATTVLMTSTTWILS